MKDNGCGIEKEKLKSNFAAFVTTKGSANNQGLGLYIARKDIEERFKGKIWVESEGKDKGANFVVELPAYNEANNKRIEEGEMNG